MVSIDSTGDIGATAVAGQYLSGATIGLDAASIADFGASGDVNVESQGDVEASASGNNGIATAIGIRAQSNSGTRPGGNVTVKSDGDIVATATGNDLAYAYGIVARATTKAGNAGNVADRKRRRHRGDRGRERHGERHLCGLAWWHRQRRQCGRSERDQYWRCHGEREPTFVVRYLCTLHHRPPVVPAMSR